MPKAVWGGSALPKHSSMLGESLAEELLLFSSPLQSRANGWRKERGFHVLLTSTEFIWTSTFQQTSGMLLMETTTIETLYLCFCKISQHPLVCCISQTCMIQGPFWRSWTLSIPIDFSGRWVCSGPCRTRPFKQQISVFNELQSFPNHESPPILFHLKSMGILLLTSVNVGSSPFFQLHC